MTRVSILSLLVLVSCAPGVVPDTTVRGLMLPVRDPTPRPLDDDDPRETPPETEPFQAPSLPAPRKEKLASGAELMLQESRGSPRVELRLIVKGAGHAGDGLTPGLASLTLRSCLEGGTLRHAGKDVSARLAALGATVERSVTERAATIRATIPQKNTNEALGLLLQALREPRLDPGEVNRIKRLEQGLLTFQESPEPWLQELERKELLQALAAPAQPPRESPGPAEIRSFWKQHYGPGALSVVLVGEPDPSWKSTIEQATSAWKATPVAATPRSPVPPRERHRILLIDQPDTPTSGLWILVPGPPLDSEEGSAFLLLQELIGAAPVGRLALAMQGSPPLAALPEARLQDQGSRALLRIHTYSNPSRVAGALGAALESLKKAADPPTEAELQGAKRRALAALQQAASSPRSLADLLERQVSLGLADDGPARRAEQLQKVEKGQISGVAKAYLSKGFWAVVTGNAAQLGPALQRHGEVAIIEPTRGFDATRTLPEQPAPPAEGR